MKQKNLLISMISIVAVLFFIGCGTMAHIEKAKNADLTKYKTYTWIDKENQKKLNHQNDIAESNIKSSVDEQLQKNGFHYVKDNPDILLTYDVLEEKTIRQQSDPVYSQPFSRLYYNPYTGRYRSIYFPSQFMGYDNQQVPVKEGTVTISMIDPKTDKTIWQGWTTDELYTRHMTSKEIDRNVKSIFKKFNVQEK